SAEPLCLTQKSPPMPSLRGALATKQSRDGGAPPSAPRRPEIAALAMTGVGECTAVEVHGPLPAFLLADPLDAAEHCSQRGTKPRLRGGRMDAARLPTAQGRAVGRPPSLAKRAGQSGAAGPNRGVPSDSELETAPRPCGLAS